MIIIYWVKKVVSGRYVRYRYCVLRRKYCFLMSVFLLSLSWPPSPSFSTRSLNPPPSFSFYNVNPTNPTTAITKLKHNFALTTPADACRNVGALLGSAIPPAVAVTVAVEFAISTGAVISGTIVPWVVVDTASPIPASTTEGGPGARAIWIVDVVSSSAGRVLVLVAADVFAGATGKELAPEDGIIMKLRRFAKTPGVSV